MVKFVELVIVLQPIVTWIGPVVAYVRGFIPFMKIMQVAFENLQRVYICMKMA